jgi:hypothetical protein
MVLSILHVVESGDKAPGILNLSTRWEDEQSALRPLCFANAIDTEYGAGRALDTSEFRIQALHS